MKTKLFQKHKGQFSMLAKGTVGEILIYDVIGLDYGGIGSMDFIQQLAALGDVDSITVRINSPGGDVFEGVAIYNALKMHPATINVQIDSLAASVATVIAMAGETITISDSGFMMIHNASGICFGEASDMRATADLLDKIRAGAMLGAYARSKISVPDLIALMDAETWYTAQEAVDAGWADSIATVPVKNASARAKFDLSAYKHPPTAAAKAQDSECECGCGQCESGLCNLCSNEDCDDEDCENCLQQGQTSAKAAENLRLSAETKQKALIRAQKRADNLRLAAIS